MPLRKWCLFWKGKQPLLSLQAETVSKFPVLWCPWKRKEDAGIAIMDVSQPNVSVCLSHLTHFIISSHLISAQLSSTHLISAVWPCPALPQEWEIHQNSFVHTELCCSQYLSRVRGFLCMGRDYRSPPWKLSLMRLLWPVQEEREVSQTMLNLKKNLRLSHGSDILILIFRKSGGKIEWIF